MVATRSGPKHDRLVRFKKGVSVRKFLDFNSPSNWDLTPECFYSDSAEINGNGGVHMPYRTEAPAENGHVTHNGGAAAAHTANQNYSLAHDYSLDNSTVADANKTIEYETNVNLSSISAVIWDTIVFIAFTLICYTIATFSYKYLDYSVYLVGTALGIVCFHYTITYYDSAEPGVLPPSPMSPSKLRRASGHTFHMSYVMSALCGVVFLLSNVWLSPSSHIPVV